MRSAACNAIIGGVVGLAVVPLAIGARVPLSVLVLDGLLGAMLMSLPRILLRYAVDPAGVAGRRCARRSSSVPARPGR